MKITSYKGVSSRTSRGVLSKARYLIDNDLFVVKANSTGKFKSLWRVAYEPYSEVMASRIANVGWIDHVHYTLEDAKFFLIYRLVESSMYLCVKTIY